MPQIRFLFQSISLLIFLATTGFSLIAQNNDPFGLCNGIVNPPILGEIPNRIPNPDFENFSQCPTDAVQLIRAVPWQVGSGVGTTPDYHNACGWIGPNIISEGLTPFPSGNGAVGMFISQNNRETVAVCLDDPFLGGDTVTVRFKIAYAPVSNFFTQCARANPSPISMTIYGIANPDCVNLAVNNVICPTNGNPNWVAIGSAVYNPQIAWEDFEIEITPQFDVQAIIIGVQCGVIANDYNLTTCNAYFMIDDFRLFGEINNVLVELEEFGDPCLNNLGINASINITGGSWQWYLDGNLLPGETDSTLFVSANNYPPGIYTAVYSDGTYCYAESIEFTITENDAPETTCPPGFELCITDPPVPIVNLSPQGGVLTGPGVNNGVFFPLQSGPGNHVLTYTVTSANNCTASCSFSVSVLDELTISCPADREICINDGAIILNDVSPGGGVFSGPGMNGNVFTPSQPGNFTITYSVQVPAFCPDTCAFEITVLDTFANIVCPDNRFVCFDDAPFTLTGAEPSDGFFSGPGVSVNIFDAAAAGVGIHEILYEWSDGSCTSRCTFFIEVPDIVPVICPGDLLICATQDTLFLPFADQPDLTITGQGVEGDLFLSALTGPGSFLIVYETEDVYGCTNSCTFFVTVDEPPVLDCPDTLLICSNADPFSLQPYSPFQGQGNWEGPGVTDPFFDPESVGGGSYLLRYFVDVPLCGVLECFTNALVIEEGQAVCPPDISTCTGERSFPLTGAFPAGGVYALNGSIISTFDPSAQLPGTYAIKYYIPGNDCIDTCTFFINNQEALPLICPESFSICLENPGVTFSGYSPLGGIFEGSGVTGDRFEPQSAGVGTHPVTYRSPQADCRIECVFIIEVTGTQLADCPQDFGLCISEPFVAFPSITPAGGQLTGPGINGNDFIPALAGVGDHRIQYELLDSAFCRYQCDWQIRVWPIPVLQASDPDPVCSNQGILGPLELVTPLGGIYTGQGITGTNGFDPAIAGSGEVRITYQFTDVNGCSAETDILLNVLEVNSAGSDVSLTCFEVDTAYLDAMGEGFWAIDQNNPGDLTLNDPDSPTSKAYDFSVAGEYRLFWISNGVCADTLLITVGDDCACAIRNNFISAPVQETCSSFQDITLQGAVPIPGGGVFRWQYSMDNGNSWIALPAPDDQQDYLVGSLPAGRYLFRRLYYPFGIDDCVHISNTIPLHVIAAANAGQAGDPWAWCQPVDTVIYLLDYLSGADPGGEWQWVQTPHTPITPVNDSLLIAGWPTGEYILSYIVQGNPPCANDTSFLQWTINPIPLAGILSQPGEIINCQISAIQLQAFDQPHVRYIWTLPEGAQRQDRIISAINPGWYYLSLTDTLSLCTNVDSVFIVDGIEYPRVTVTTPDIINCFNSEVLLDGSLSEENTNLVYEWLDANGTLIQTGTRTLLVDQGGIYIFRIRDTINFCVGLDTVEVFINTTPPSLVIPDTLTLVCSQTIGLLNAVSDVPIAALQGSWTSNTGVITRIFNALQAEVDGAGWYYLELIDLRNGCRSMDSLLLVVSDENIQLEAVGRELCPGETFSSVVLSSNGTPPLEFRLGNATNTSGIFTGVRAGIYVAVVKDARNCIQRDSITVRYKDAQAIQLAGRILIEKGDTVLLDPQLNFIPAEVLWTPPLDIRCDTCLATEVWPLVQRVYTLETWDDDGCFFAAEVLILVRKTLNIYVPDAFTPNGDGNNDGFTVFGPDVARIKSMFIFDRWGNKVFGKEDFPANEPMEGWDGIFRQQAMTPAVFAYKIRVEDIEGNEQILSGEVQLIR
jgi:gliding motility-associated-like protein